MMGTREPLKGGIEYDYLTRAKRWHACRNGIRQWVKAKFWRRVRRSARAAIKTEVE